MLVRVKQNVIFLLLKEIKTVICMDFYSNIVG